MDDVTAGKKVPKVSCGRVREVRSLRGPLQLGTASHPTKSCSNRHDAIFLCKLVPRHAIFDFIGPLLTLQNRWAFRRKIIKSPVRSFQRCKRQKKSRTPPSNPTKPTCPPPIVIQPATRRGRGLCRVKPPSRVISNGLGPHATSLITRASGRPPQRSGWAPEGGI